MLHNNSLANVILILLSDPIYPIIIAHLPQYYGVFVVGKLAQRRTFIFARLPKQCNRNRLLSFALYSSLPKLQRDCFIRKGA